MLFYLYYAVPATEIGPRKDCTLHHNGTAQQFFLYMLVPMYPIPLLNVLPIFRVLRWKAFYLEGFRVHLYLSATSLFGVPILYAPKKLTGLIAFILAPKCLTALIKHDLKCHFFAFYQCCGSVMIFLESGSVGLGSYMNFCNILDIHFTFVFPSCKL